MRFESFAFVSIQVDAKHKTTTWCSTGALSEGGQEGIPTAPLHVWSHAAVAL